MAQKKKGKTTGGQKGKTRLIDMPAANRVPDSSSGRWDAKVTMTDKVMRQKYRERARKAALTKRKKAQELSKSLQKAYKDVAELVEQPILEKKKRPLAGAALQQREAKIKRDAEKAAKEEEAKLTREIEEQAQREIEVQLQQEQADRRRYQDLRDAKREARSKIIRRVNSMRQQQKSAQTDAADAEHAQQMEDVQELPDQLEDLQGSPAGTVTASKRSVLGSLRSYMSAVKRGYDQPRWYRPSTSNGPTGVPKTGFYYDDRGDLWKDGRKITGTDKSSANGRLATDYQSAKQDALNKPTGLPAARQEALEKLQAMSGNPVMQIRTQTGKRANFQVSLVDKQGKPMDVVFEREVTELEKLSALQMAQQQWEKQETRKKDQKEHKSKLDEARFKDLFHMPQVVKDASRAFLKPAKTMLGELKNVAEGILGIAGLFAALYGLKKAADNAVPIISGTVDAILSMQEAFYRMTGQNDKADAVAQRRAEGKASLNPEEQKTAETAGTVAKGAVVAGGLWAGLKATKFIRGAAALGRSVMGLGGAGAGGAGAAAGGTAGVGAAAVAGAATLGVEGYLGVYKPIWGEQGKNSAEVFKQAAMGDPRSAVLYASAQMGKNASDADILKAAAGTMTKGFEGIPNSGRDFATNLALATTALKKIKQEGNGSMTYGTDAIDKALPAGSAKRDAKDVSADSGKAVQYLMSKGMSKEAAIGVASSFQAESDFGTTSFNPEGGGQGALGIGQWRGQRQKALLDFLKKRGKTIQNSTMEDQLDFAMSELQGSEKGAGAALSMAKTPQEAADIMLKQYERPYLNSPSEISNSEINRRRNIAAQISRGTLPVGQAEDVALMRQKIAAQSAAPAAGTGAPAGSGGMLPMQSNWQNKPGMHADYLDDPSMWLLNGGFLGG